MFPEDVAFRLPVAEEVLSAAYAELVAKYLHQLN